MAPKLRYILTMLALLAIGALFGGSLYDTFVLAPNLHGGPVGLEHGRLFMSRIIQQRSVSSS